MSDEAEILKEIQSILKGAVGQNEPRSLSDNLKKLVGFDPRGAYPYMSKQEYDEMMKKNNNKKDGGE